MPPLCAVHVKGGPGDVAYERRDDVFGADTTEPEGTTGGLVYAPENPNSGKRCGISYVLVSVCSPTPADEGSASTEDDGDHTAGTGESEAGSEAADGDGSDGEPADSESPNPSERGSRDPTAGQSSTDPDGETP